MYSAWYNFSFFRINVLRNGKSKGVDGVVLTSGDEE